MDRNRKIGRICKRNTYFIHIEQSDNPKKLELYLNNLMCCLVCFVLFDFTRIQKSGQFTTKDGEKTIL